MKASDIHVDHFIPRGLYPVDLGHNFVLADAGCNAAKSDHLAAPEHLERWSARNQDVAAFLSGEFDRRGIVHDLHASRAIARWAYGRAAAVGAETFRSRGVFQPSPKSWPGMGPVS